MNLALSHSGYVAGFLPANSGDERAITGFF